MRIKSADLKNKFLFSSFTAFGASLMLGEAADYHMLLRMIGQIKLSGDRFRCGFFRLSLRREGVLGICLPVSPMYNLLQRVQVIQ